jgi:hypothetical protein
VRERPLSYYFVRPHEHCELVAVDRHGGGALLDVVGGVDHPDERVDLADYVQQKRRDVN